MFEFLRKKSNQENDNLYKVYFTYHGRGGWDFCGQYHSRYKAKFYANQVIEDLYSQGRIGHTRIECVKVT